MSADLFHCELLREAGEKLGEDLAEVEIQPFTIPYVTNVTAQYVTEPEQVKELLDETGLVFRTLAAVCGADDP